MTIKISLYIPCFNAEKTVDECIKAVLNQTYPIDEIIVIDDGSTDNTALIASRYNINPAPCNAGIEKGSLLAHSSRPQGVGLSARCGVKIIQHKINMGLSASRNTGVSNSRNEYIASIDADCVPAPDWIEKLIDNFTIDNIAGAGGQLIEANIKTLADQWRAQHLTQSWGNKQITNPRHLFGNNTIFRKSALLDAGLYNLRYKTNAEDYDISQRLIKKGYTLIYDPKAKAKHIRGDNICSVMDIYSKYYYFGFTRKINIINLIRGIFINLYFSASFFIRDLLNCRIYLLPLDIFSFVFAVYKNICRSILS